MRTCIISTLASAMLVSALSFSDGAHLRPPTQPTITMQAGTKQPFGTLLFSPDGKRLAGIAVAAHHGEPAIEVWDAATGKRLFTRSWHANVTLSARFNNDGTLLVASAPVPADKPGAVQLWDAATGKKLRTLNGADAGPVTISPDGKLVTATGGQPASLGIWYVATGNRIRALEGNADAGLTFSPDGKLLAGIDAEGRVRVWNVATGKVVQTLKGMSAGGLAFSPDSKRVAAGASILGIVRVWEVASGRELLEMRNAHVKGVVSVAFSPDGKRLVTGGNRRHTPGLFEGWPVERDGEVKIWDATTGTELLAFRVTDVGGLGSMSLAPDGQRVAVSTISGSRATIWTLPSAVPALVDSAKPTVMAGSRDTSCWSLAFSSDGQRLAGGFDDGITRVWEAKTGKEIRTFRLEESWCYGIAFNADGTVLAIATAGTPIVAEKPGRIVLWDLKSGNALRTLEGGGAGGVAFSPNGKILVGTATGKPAALKLWDTATGKTVRALAESGLDGIAGVPVAFSPDGKTIIGAARDGKVRIWEASSGKILHTLDANSSPVAFSKDGKRVVAGSMMFVWEAATGKKLLAIKEPHVKGNVGVAFSPDGKRLISAGNRPHSAGLLGLLQPWPPDSDGEVTLWDAEKGTKMRSFVTNVAGLWTSAVSPDGTRIAVSPQSGGRVAVWSLPSSASAPIACGQEQPDAVDGKKGDQPQKPTKGRVIVLIDATTEGMAEGAKIKEIDVPKNGRKKDLLEAKTKGQEGPRLNGTYLAKTCTITLADGKRLDKREVLVAIEVGQQTLRDFRYLETCEAKTEKGLGKWYAYTAEYEVEK
jgi:WD40 repeat protein